MPLFTDNFYERPFATTTVKFAVKNPLPGAEIQFSVRDCHHHLTPHNLAFHVGIGIVLADIVTVPGDRLMGAIFSSQIS